MKEYLPYIALTVSLLIAIFRNPLSQLGDNLIKKKDVLLNFLFHFTIAVILFAPPLYNILQANKSSVLDKAFVFKIAANCSVFVFNFLILFVRYFYVAKSEVKKMLDNRINQVLNNIAKGINEIKTKEDEELSNALEEAKKLK